MTEKNFGDAYALTLEGQPQANLERLITWLCSDSRFDTVVWHIDDLESNVPLELDIGNVAMTTELRKLLAAQIIELDLLGRETQRDAWRVIVRDGASVDFLGHGTVPSPEILGARFEVRDAAQFLWT